MSRKKRPATSEVRDSATGTKPVKDSLSNRAIFRASLVVAVLLIATIAFATFANRRAAESLSKPSRDIRSAADTAIRRERSGD